MVNAVQPRLRSITMRTGTHDAVASPSLHNCIALGPNWASTRSYGRPLLPFCRSGLRLASRREITHVTSLATGARGVIRYVFQAMIGLSAGR